jgi:UDP-3-O-[3-hydroxymyristoyl] glucosamine N-acyltransferase
MRLDELAKRLGAELRANDPETVGDTEISGVDGIETAGPSQVTFVSNKKYAGLAKSTKAAAVLVEFGFPEIGTTTLRVTDPYMAYAKAIELFYEEPRYEPGIHPTAVIAATARIGTGAHVGPYVVVGEQCVVGEGAVLHPHVVLYPYVQVGARFIAHAHAVVREHCRLGDDVILQNGAVIGADGFGFARVMGAEGGAGWYKIRQSGPAVLEDRVEVQANACVDGASIGETRIKAGAKIDNLVQVGHGSTVGEDTLLCSQVGLAGSTTVGKNVILAGQVGVAGHCKIGDGVVATAQSGIPNDVIAGKMVSGYPAIDNRQWLRSVALFNRLPEILKGLRDRQKD